MKQAAYNQYQREAGNDLIQEYLPLVKKIANYWSARLPASVELDDLMQVGLIGLLHANDSFDASRGASFATYAAIRVKGAILDEVRRNDWLPRSVQQKMRQVSEAIAKAEASLGRAPTDADIAHAMGLPLTEYQTTARELASCRMTSLDEFETERPGDEGDNPVHQTQESGFREALVKGVEQLPEKEKLVMSLYYTEELNLKEIGAILEVSESRVSQIHGQALARLRSKMRDWTE